MSARWQLRSAVLNRKNEKVNKLLNEMTVDEVNGKHKEETALHVACKRSNHEALDLLLSKPGIDVNVRDCYGDTPLVIACINRNVYAALKILNTTHADVNVEEGKGYAPLYGPPLYVACKGNLHEIVSALLAIPDIRVNVRSAYGYTPIMVSAMHCHKEALKLMLEDSRVDLNIKDGNGDELNVLVGKVAGTKEQKEECVEMINKERIKRANRHVEQGQTGPDGSVGMCIEKIEKLNKEIENGEKKLEDRLGIKKRKMDLKGKQTLEKQTLVKKHKVEDAALDEKHKEEENMLDATFAKEKEVERRRISILKERRDELVQNVQKKASEPDKDTASNDHEKLESAKKSLECPICMELMRPPTRIWMCQFTHMICEGCRERLNGGNCPTCTTEAVTQRAFMAENLARTIFND